MIIIIISLLKYSTQSAIYTLKVYIKKLSKTYLQFISIKKTIFKHNFSNILFLDMRLQKEKRDYFQA